MDIVNTLNEYGMQIANLLFIYAWAGWVLLMLPTLLVLLATGWALKYAANRAAYSLMDVYKLSAIRYYFRLMEKNGTHALKKEADKTKST